MKYLTATITFLLFASGSIAQNYWPVQTGAIPYFYNKNSGYVRAMRIDSVSSVGTDFIYHPFRTPRCWADWTEVDTAGGCWLGKKIIRKQDGTFLFDNIWGNDTTRILTQASLGDSWIFYQTWASKYMAEVIAIDTMSFLNITDSVKKIRLSAYDANNNLLPGDSLHGLELILSKDHGFVQAFDIYTFPYHPPGQQFGEEHYMNWAVAWGQHGKTFSPFVVTNYNFNSIASQYDRQVGDVYQYATGPDYYPVHWTPYSLDSIISIMPLLANGWDAWPQQWSNHMFYYYNNQPPPQNIWEMTFSDALPEEMGQRCFYYYYPADTNFCLNTPLYKFETNFIEYNWGGTAFLHLSFETFHDFWWYKTNIGMVKFVTYTWESWLSDRRLIYYNKNGNPCGTNISAQSLPIELAFVNATNEGSHNRVIWQVESEPVGLNYEVERSKDGKEFTPIGSVPAKGSTVVSYSLIDESPFPGKNYYRVKSIEAGGKSTYSKVVTAVLLREDLLSVYPNPATNSVSVSGNHIKSATLTNLEGQVLFQQPAEHFRVKFDLSELPAGTYFIVAEMTDGRTVTNKVTKN